MTKNEKTVVIATAVVVAAIPTIAFAKKAVAKVRNIKTNRETPTSN